MTWPRGGVLALAVLAGPALAQDYGETVEVNIVTVDVEVRDAQGRQVTDLERRDFQVLEDGDRMELTNFERVVQGSSAPAATAGPAAPAAAPAADAVAQPAADSRVASWVIVYVDNLHLHASNRTKALAQVRRLLGEGVVAGERVMVASQDMSLNVRLPFSGDRAAIDAALAQVETLPTSGQVADSDKSTALKAIVAAQQECIRVGQPCCYAIAEPPKAYAYSARADVRRTLDRLRFLINSLGGLPGRKALVYVSDGISLQPGQELFQVLTEMCGGGAATSGAKLPDELDPFDSLTLGPSAYPAHAAALDAATYSTSEDLRKVASHASANRVSLYTLQASGLAALASSTAAFGAEERLLQLPSVASIAADNDKQSLVYLAHETGGRAIIDTNDFGGGLGRMREDLATFYSLGYAPKHQGDGKEHHIEVRVKRPGAQLAYRRNYRDKPPLEQAADRTLAALLHGYEDNPLGVTVEMLPTTELPNGHFLATARLLVPLFKLATITRGDVHEAKLRVMVIASDPGGEATALRQVEVPIVVPHLQALTAFGQSYAYEVGMELTAGEHVVAFGVRDELGATTSYLRQKLRVSAPAAARKAANGTR